MSTSLTTKDFFARNDVKAKFEELLGKRAPQFMTSVLQIVSNNSLLQKADPVSIYNSAAVAATLNLPISNQLGFAYIIPYGSSAQFQIGAKGFIQLALRSGQFKTISSAPIYDGQLVSEDPLRGFVFDFSKKGKTIIGYAAFFELLNGFQKTVYMTVDEVKKHGQRYSKTFGKESSVWKTDFDAMAEKTVLKRLISKYAPLSIEMEKAIATDQAVINNTDGTDVTYIDTEPLAVEDPEFARWRQLIADCKSVEDVDALKAPADMKDFVDMKKEELTKTGKKR